MTEEQGGPPRPTARRMEDQPTGAVPLERKPGARSKGTRNTIVVVAAVIVAATLSAAFGYFVLADKAEDESAQTFGSTDCSLVSDDDLSEELGLTIDAFRLPSVGGVSEALADGRVRLEGTTCFASSPDADLSVSISEKKTDDAEEVYATQKAAAQTGESESAYFAEDVPGVGDEAFCTTTSTTGYVGVLARSGDELVYTAVASPALVATQEAGCDLAAKAATAVLS